MAVHIAININIRIPGVIVGGDGLAFSMFGAYRIVNVVIQALGGEREDQNIEDITEGSLLVLLRCFTNERFLEVFEDYKSGRMKNRLNREFLDIGIETEGMVLDIENIEELEVEAAAIRMR